MNFWRVTDVKSKFFTCVLLFPRSRELSLDSPLTLSICMLTILSLKALSNWYFSTSLQRCQVFHYQSKSCCLSKPDWYGWQDVESRNWSLSVGLICRSLSSYLYHQVVELFNGQSTLLVLPKHSFIQSLISVWLFEFIEPRAFMIEERQYTITPDLQSSLTVRPDREYTTWRVYVYKPIVFPLGFFDEMIATSRTSEDKFHLLKYRVAL